MIENDKVNLNKDILVQITVMLLLLLVVLLAGSWG